MEIKKTLISNITPYGKNAKKHPKKQVKQVAASIKEFGFNQPIVVDKDNVVIVGHGRLEAAKSLGLEEVPVLQVDLTEEQAKAYRLADNKLNESEWDMELVIEELKGLEPAMIDLTGFEVDLVIDKEIEEDEVPDVPEEPKAKLGDLYQLGEHRLLCGDATKIEDVERLMDGEKADMVFTDPPYGIGEAAGKNKSRGHLAKAQDYGNLDWDNEIPKKEAFEHLALFSKEQVIFGGNYFTQHLAPSPSWIVWDKNNTGDFADCELAWTSHNKAVRKYKQTWNGMIREGESEKRVHPTQKPIALASWCFEQYGNPSTVLDLFGGSGSTLMACEQTNRKCYMMELDPRYIDVIIKRWEDFTGETAVKLN